MLLVTGASGFLGANIALAAADEGRRVVGVTHRRAFSAEGVKTVGVDLTALEAVPNLLKDFKPDWVLNCAALANVDQCERDTALARQLNVDLPAALARACAEHGARLLHVSTDSVFDGMRGAYTELDEPRPLNEYARTKRAGEAAVMTILPAALVLRTNFVGFSADGKTGLADWITSRAFDRQTIPGFCDVTFAPLLVNELAKTMLEMIDLELSGLYHVGAGDSSTKHDFARRLCAALGADADAVTPAFLADAALHAPRPLNTSLSSAKAAEALGRPMPSVDEAIDGYAALRRSGYPERLRATMS
ncbi:MAG TPA: SDR family oxidoreductase [Gemmatimonadaceae bacterium]|nr:SDR family oxidoreductase [Gemmatimonadaceae bacterium]